MWLLVRRSGFALGARCAGTGRTCEPVLVDEIDLA
jgi:hypothetical protein